MNYFSGTVENKNKHTNSLSPAVAVVAAVVVETMWTPVIALSVLLHHGQMEGNKGID